MTEVDLDRMPVAAGGSLRDKVPVIDLEGFSPADRTALVDAVASACREWGFFQIVNHGVSAELIADLWRETRRFFARPAAEKEAVLRTRDNPWGYYNNELTKNQRDRKEVFDFTVDERDPIYRRRNRWPANAPRFERVMREYRDACEDVARKLIDIVAADLGAGAEQLAAAFAPRHTGFVRLNYYPVHDPLRERGDVPHLETADLGVHHHTDAGALTVLLQDRVGGLQVFRDGHWHDVEPLHGALVINTGDMLQVWSNDRYRAAIHRVLAMDSADRFSVPFFYNPSAGAVVRPLCAPDRAHYRPIDWAEFRARRTDGDYADYGTEVQISDYRLSG